MAMTSLAMILQALTQLICLATAIVKARAEARHADASPVTAVVIIAPSHAVNGQASPAGVYLYRPERKTLI